MKTMEEYIKELEEKEANENKKWEEYAAKQKELQARNAVLAGAARFADTYAQLNPVGVKSNYAGGLPTAAESEQLAQNLLAKTKPSDSSTGMLRLYQQQMQQSQRQQKGGGLNLTKGQEKRDIKVAQEMADYEDFGGAAEVSAQLDNLELINNQLLSGEVKTGKGLLGGELSQAAGWIPGSDISVMKQNIASAIQGTMRPILGAQFTENEGKRIIENAFSPAASPQENARRVSALITKLKQMHASKMEKFDYFDKKGTVVGAPRQSAKDIQKEILSSMGMESSSASDKMKTSMPNSRPKKVVQNGVTYTLNEATGEYE